MSKFRNVVRAATGSVWLVFAGDLIVPDEVFQVSGQWGRILIGLAIVGSIAIIVDRFQRPVEEVFDAGREYQRRVDMRERNRHASVSPIRHGNPSPLGRLALDRLNASHRGETL